MRSRIDEYGRVEYTTDNPHPTIPPRGKPPTDKTVPYHV